MNQRNSGFTMIEMLVVMAILGILAAAVLPLSETQVKAHKERQLREGLWEIRDALDHYKQFYDQGLISAQAPGNGYPPDLLTLAQGSPQVLPDKTISSTAKHYFLRRIPRDPFADPALPAEKTWGLRSYASPPDRPEPGSDVFDVFSTSTLKAMDGTNYNQW
jgi:general secretion pathway protein G